MPIIVQKYGGTSIDSREKILGVARRVVDLRRQGYGIVVVVSAQGQTTSSLIKLARDITDSPSQRELDMLMTAGERISMSLLAIALNSLGCRAVSFTGSQVGIITDTRHTDARILEVRPHRLVKELERGNVVVVGGFQGVSVEKEVTTLGRGGSDTTAVALAASLGAERCEILTDVEGVFTADPSSVDGARRIDELSYEDMSEMARFGAAIVKEDAVRLARESGIEIYVGSSSGPAVGTIVLEEPSRVGPPVTGISLDSDVDLISAPRGSLADIVDALAEVDLEIALCMLRGDGLSLVVRHPTHTDHGLAARADAVVQPAGVLCVAGPGASIRDVGARAIRTLEELGRPPLAVSSTERSTLLIVSRESALESLRALHDAFFPPASA